MLGWPRNQTLTGLAYLKFQDRTEKGHLKGDYIFHTDHAIELVAKVLVQMDKENDIRVAVDVRDRYSNFQTHDTCFERLSSGKRNLRLQNVR